MVKLSSPLSTITPCDSPSHDAPTHHIISMLTRRHTTSSRRAADAVPGHPPQYSRSRAT